MAKAKKKLSFEEHVEIGKELSRIQDYLISLHVKVANLYPQTVGNSGKAIRSLKTSHESVADAKCWLEEILAKEHPEQFTPKIYYGGIDKDGS